MIDSQSFGYTNGIIRKTLQGVYVPPATGIYTLHIDNTRNAVSSTCIYNYIDNISLLPWGQTLKADVKNIDCVSGGEVKFKLNAGGANKDRDYWIWLNFTGTYPGFSLSGVTVPLNQDPLFEFGLCNPCFAGTTGFMGKLNAYGQAEASILLPPDPRQDLVGIPINFAYVVLSPGPSTPILYASIPVHVKYVP